MDIYAAYLRKSRADREAEMRGEGETLARHETLLRDTAKRMGITISVFFREIVSGETIDDRPVMQELLSQVEQGIWSGVFVVEVERLARGDSIDQGIISRAFRLSGTKIITPFKTYDPQNEFDEEYFEFGLFMSRREYKTINRRLQAGRTASICEGKYVGSVPPYGYRRVKLKKDKGYTLEPIPEQAEVVNLIYRWFSAGAPQPDGSIQKIGPSLIARRLNELGKLPARNQFWTESSIRDILKNPVYIGKIRWNRRKTVKSVQNNQLIKTRPRQENYILTDGLHPPIISDEDFNAAQELMELSKRSHPNLRQRLTKITNPLAGIVKCGICGHNMVRRPSPKRDSLMCQYHCGNMSSYFDTVEDRLLEAMEAWLQNYKLSWSAPSDEWMVESAKTRKLQLRSAEAELEKEKRLLDRVYELLEQQVYTIDQFMDRRAQAEKRIADLEGQILNMQKEIDRHKQIEESAAAIIPKMEKIIEVYRELDSPEEKNRLLKEVLEKVVYKKSQKNSRGGNEDAFTLEIYPRLPKL